MTTTTPTECRSIAACGTGPTRACSQTDRSARRLWLVAAIAAAAAALTPTPAVAQRKAGAKAEPAALVPPKLVTFVEPEYPPEMMAKGLRGEVIVQLVVEADGSVGKVEVVKSAGAAFDAAAIAAARKLVFEPARQGDDAVRVAIQFRFAFAPRERLDRRGRSAGLGRYARREAERAPAGFASLRGVVTERGTGRPVVGALVTITAQGAETVTEADGSYSFGLLAPGGVEVYLPGAEHKPLRAKATIREGRTTTLDLRATRRSYTIYRATATAPPEPGEMTRRSLSAAEIQKIPGVNGDAFKVVQSLPGVARAPGGAGFIIVRGSAPGDTQVFVEGVRLPTLYHFAGIYSIFNTDMLEGIDFMPGGYAVRYGRGTGGVLQARLALPREDGERRWKGYVESNVFHTGALVGGPVGERGNLTIAARRSYIDAVLSAPPLAKALPLTLAPRYYDFQLKYDHRLGPRTSLTAFAFGSDDRLRAVLDEPPAAFPDARGNVETATSFFGALAVLRHEGDGWKSKTTFGSVLTRLNFGLADLFRFDLTSNEFTLRQDFTFGEGPVQLRAGMDWVWQPFTIEVLLPNIAQGSDRGTTAGGAPSASRIFAKQTGSQYQPAVYVDSVFRLSDALEVVPGVRFDFYRKLADAQTVTPRLNLRWQADDKLVVKAATGTTSQQPSPQQLAEGVGTPSLLPQQSWETSAGVEWRALDFLSLDVTLFHKRLWDITVPSKELFPTTAYTNDGTGRVVGMELLLRHELANNFFGWISYTLSRATRVDEPSGVERPFGWDQTHILALLGSYKLPDNWSIGARWRYVTGNPQTSLATAVYNEQNDTYTRVSSTCILCDRVPSFHQLDVRVDKTFVFNRFLLGVYLDVQNAYNRANPEGIQYNFDASQSQYSSGLPIIPSFGVRGEF